MRLAVLAAFLALSSCTAKVKEPQPSPELEQALSLLRCPPQGMRIDDKNFGVRDCANFESYQWGGADRSGTAIRYALTPGSTLQTAVIQFVSRNGIETLFTEKDVDPDAHAFMVRLTPEGGEDIVIPVVRESGKRSLSIWLSDFLEAQTPSAAPYVHAGDIPAGQVVAWRPECGLFAASLPPHTNPWRLTLYRAKDIQEYRVGRLGFDVLGELNVMKDAGGGCVITGADAIGRSGLAPEEFDGEICRWLEESGYGDHHIPDC